MPDPKIEAVEGSGAVPAYRGTAYVVIEDLALDRFGNRVPQFNFEVVRATPKHLETHESDYSETVRAVALMPGTGEYALATTPVYCDDGFGATKVANQNTPSGLTDFVTSMQELHEELPNCGATSLVVSWFGNDLRIGDCKLRPKVESTSTDGRDMPWQVAGLSRSIAETIAEVDGRPVYGGTPTDVSVIQAIEHLSAAGTEVMFYPFILMEQLAGNSLPDPWSAASDQPELPWRGRITTSIAPGRAGSPDGTAQADAEVAVFFGSASASDFHVGDKTVSYHGPDEWSYRRFILHNAALCAAAGGVDAFCIGSEMRSMTQIRGASGFPGVQALKQLAAEVRILVGPEVKLGYAADWSEYFGYHPQDGTGDVYFHLDSLWADPEIDFVGIDNYMPLSDWRDGNDHIDAQNWESLHSVEYLRSNVAGGEGFDWFYPSIEARQTQNRAPIEDGAHGEPWVFRYKDLKNWWSQPHHERVGGSRAVAPTGWIPMSKPIWFTEIGCAAIDKATNQPNKFLDEKSSESATPHHSTGFRDEAIQQLYYQAIHSHYTDPDNNPTSPVYGTEMVDQQRMFAWAWDARPFPAFPNARLLWSDGANYAKGHWINGRTSHRSLSSVVEEICDAAGVAAYDVSGLRGIVRGCAHTDISHGRAALQPLMIRHGFDAVERDGRLSFVMRDARPTKVVDPSFLSLSSDVDGDIEFDRQSDAELAGRIRLNFVLAERDFEAASEEAVLHDEATFAVAQSEVEEVLTRAEGRQATERWLAESRVSRDRVKLALPPSQIDIGAGDVLCLGNAQGGEALFRIDRATQQGAQVIEGARVEPSIYRSAEMHEDRPRSSLFRPPVPVQSFFLDVPLMAGDESPNAPHLAATSRPWPGNVAVYTSLGGDGFTLEHQLSVAATVAVTETSMSAAPPARLDMGEPLIVRMLNGAPTSVSAPEMLAGSNLAFIGDGGSDGWEAFQFQNAELIGVGQFALSTRLRGQLGTEIQMPPVWPEGSWVVFVDGALSQLKFPSSFRGIARHFRIGPAHRPVNDASFSQHVEAFAGLGLRPYAPVHLAAERHSSGDLHVSWVRRTRIDGDSWSGLDVPLGEEREAYLVRVKQDTTVLREVQVEAPSWVYTVSQQADDGWLTEKHSGQSIEVAQISASFGAGTFGRLIM